MHQLRVTDTGLIKLCNRIGGAKWSQQRLTMVDSEGPVRVNQVPLVTQRLQQGQKAAVDQ